MAVVYKCKMCGGDLDVQTGKTVCECEYCGAKQTVSSVDDEIIVNLFNRANNLRIKSEFDKAQEIYEKIVSKKPNESEAYWGIVLCKYRIEYVEDPSTFNRVPTCHRKMTDLADYIIDITGLENPPRIEFYNNPQEGDYGGFDRTTNTLSVNEHMLYQNDEAADTIAHELWHALQYQRASNPRTKLDAMYAENFNDYISPQEDFEGYQSQILEAEARAFAQQIKDRLHSY